MLRRVNVTRYMQPLREGGSLPALAEADDGFKYVIKFRGSGNGVRILIAEYIGGEIARALGLKVPEMVFANLDECFGRTEGDEEIQDLLKASQGLNLGLHFLSGAFTYDPAVTKPDALLASKIVWLDAFIMNVDRTFRNTNMLVWNKEIWLIDHGASLYLQYNEGGLRNKAGRAFPMIRDHVLLPHASRLGEAEGLCRELITEEKIREITKGIPAEWIEAGNGDADEYFGFLSERLRNSQQFIREAQDAKISL
jgi:hypothetical protein